MKMCGGFWAGCALVVLMGFAPILSKASTVESGGGKDAVFYPPLPNPPRVQYLVTFSGENDFAKEKSSFTKFIVGDEEVAAPSLQQPYGVAG